MWRRERAGKMSHCTHLMPSYTTDWSFFVPTVLSCWVEKLPATFHCSTFVWLVRYFSHFAFYGNENAPAARCATGRAMSTALSVSHSTIYSITHLTNLHYNIPIFGRHHYFCNFVFSTDGMMTCVSCVCVAETFLLITSLVHLHIPTISARAMQIYFVYYCCDRTKRKTE